MRNVLAVVSDLHLGSLPALDDFVLDERFDALLAVLDGGNDSCELALLGDTFDMWQAVDQAECSSEVIPETVTAPSTAEAEIARLDRIRSRHARPRCADGARYVNSGTWPSARRTTCLSSSPTT